MVEAFYGSVTDAEQARAARARGGGDVGGEAVHPGGGEQGEGEAFFGPGGDDARIGLERVVRLDGDGGQGAAQAVHEGAVMGPAASRDQTVGEARQEVDAGHGRCCPPSAAAAVARASAGERCGRLTQKVGDVGRAEQFRAGAFGRRQGEVGVRQKAREQGRVGRPEAASAPSSS